MNVVSFLFWYSFKNTRKYWRRNNQHWNYYPVAWHWRI